MGFKDYCDIKDMDGFNAEEKAGLENSVNAVKGLMADLEKLEY